MKLLDTSAWVEYFKGSEQGVRIKEMLGEGYVYTSYLTLAEIARWFHENGLDVAKGIQQLKANSILIPLEEELLVQSGKAYPGLRKLRPKMGMIDVIIYATARMHGLTVVTTYPDFEDLPHVHLL